MYFEFKDYLKDNKSYKDMLDSMIQEIDVFMKNFKDDSRFVSGWGHGYFCNEDGGRLVYDITKPFEHKCSICGRVYNHYQYDACYITMLRNEAIVTAVKAALAYNILEDKKYLDVSKSIINFYADHYEHFAVHAKDRVNCDPTTDVGGAGKIMPQGLNEAIVAIRIINALELIKKDVAQEWMLQIKTKLFQPMVDLLLPQKMHIHNIPTWINSAIGIMGIFYKDKDWIQEATQNPFNLFEQIRKGVTESGFWYEGSIHYNFFALEGITNFLVLSKSYGFEIPQDVEETVLHMLDAAYHYAFDNDIFPNPSDGWPNISLKTYSYVYYMGYKIFGDKVLPYIQHIEENTLERTRMPLSEPYYYNNEIPMERLLFGPNIMTLETIPAQSRTSKNFEKSNCAILRNECFNVFMKYGHQTRSHAHPDKMNIEIMVGDKVLTKDLSNSGYVSKLCNKWHRKIASHNTCVVNAMPTDIENPGKILTYDLYTIEAEADAYENVKYRRKIKLMDHRLEDVFTVESKEKGTIDWFFHFETPVEKDSLKTKDVQLFAEYEYILNAQEIETTDGHLMLENELVNVDICLEDGVKAYISKTYNNPANKMRDTIILRKESNQAQFSSIICAKK